MEFINEEISKFSNSYKSGELRDKCNYMENEYIKRDKKAEKVFVPRNSLLTDLYEDKNIKTIYNICLSILTGLAVTTAVEDYLQEGRLILTFSLIYSGFSNLHIFFLLWCLLFASTLMTYVGFKYWALIRTQYVGKATDRKLWDCLNVAVFIAYCLSLLYFATYAATQVDYAIAELTIFYIEVTRFLMKICAFVRSNVPRVLTYKSQVKNEVLYPKFTKFLYYLFAPTLLYRDDYPRSAQIRWKFVLTCFMEIIGVTFFVSFVVHRYIVPLFQDYGIKPLPWQNILIAILELSGIVYLSLIAVCYALMHSWQNAFAEMLRFSDRQFYKDWWTATDPATFFQKWSLLVHEWLHTYVYKDLYEIFNHRKFPAVLTTFLVSFMFHDYVIVFPFRTYVLLYTISFLLPVMCLYYMKVKNDTIGNIFMWYGYAIMFNFYFVILVLEYYSTINCPTAEKFSYYQFVTLKLLRCYK